MSDKNQQIGEGYVKLALAINEHLSGYVDSYFGPEAWMQAKRLAKFRYPIWRNAPNRL